jgi:hypothetical protein
MDILGAIEGLWLGQIERAKKVKKKQFGETAERAWKYYGDGNHNFLYEENSKNTGESRISMPLFPVTCNLTAEYVRMMLPYIHNKAPARRVAVRPNPFEALFQPPQQPQFGQQPGMPPQPPPVNPQDVAKRFTASALNYMLSYTPDRHDLRAQCRSCVTESLVKGRGVAWHEFEHGLPGSFFDSVDNLLVDPDAEQLRHAAFIVRVRRRPVWAVAEEFGIPREQIRGSYTSGQKQAQNSFEVSLGSESGDRDKELSADVVKYYEVYSRMGVGHKFVGVADEIKQAGTLLDAVGEHAYLAILPGFGSPLNLPKDSLSEATTAEDITSRLSWPVAYFGNVIDPWPCTCLDYYVHPRQAWPSSPLEPSLPLQAFMDYAYSFLMARLRSTCRDIIIASKAIDSALTKALKYGRDQEVVFHDGTNQDIENLIHVLQFPPVNRDIYEVLRMVEQAFRQSTGLVELMYGANSRAMRSAEEASVLQTNMSIRPEDMADMVEDWHSRMSGKEAAAMRLHVPGAMFAKCAGDVTPANSPMPSQLAMAWDLYVAPQGLDPYDAASEMLYTVDAGTGRKRNLQKEMSDVKEAMSFMFGPSLQHYQQSGDPKLVNGLLKWWSDSHQADSSVMMMPDMRAQMMAQQQAMQQQQAQPQPQQAQGA